LIFIIFPILYSGQQKINLATNHTAGSGRRRLVPWRNLSWESSQHRLLPASPSEVFHAPFTRAKRVWARFTCRKSYKITRSNRRVFAFAGTQQSSMALQESAGDETKVIQPPAGCRTIRRRCRESVRPSTPCWV
jgi:hypothetical protein